MDHKWLEASETVLSEEFDRSKQAQGERANDAEKYPAAKTSSISIHFSFINHNIHTTNTQKVSMNEAEILCW